MLEHVLELSEWELHCLLGLRRARSGSYPSRPILAPIAALSCVVASPDEGSQVHWRFCSQFSSILVADPLHLGFPSSLA